MTKVSAFFDKVIAATAPSKPPINLDPENEDANNTATTTSNGYPQWANKIGQFVYMLWDKCLWTPFSRTWAWLNRWTNLTFWIFASIPIGVLVGYYQPEFATEIQPLGTAFIRMIKICVVPLIFSTLVVGIAGHGDDISKIGKLAIKTIIYFEIITTFALALGLIMANLIKPGQGVELPPESDNEDANDLAKKSGDISWDGEMFLIIPENFFAAAVEDQMLGIVFCAAMFACAAIKADAKSREVMMTVCESLSQVTFKMVALIMNYAPIGIGASLASTVGKNGIGVLANLGKLIGGVYAALVIFFLAVFIPLLLIFRIPIGGFLRAMGQPWLIAFSTSSSESALPKAMERMREFGCPNAIVSFVIPTGYSFNLDGGTIYMSLGAIFCAQAGGMSLPIATQLSIMGTLMLTSKGIAAVPRGSMIIMAGTISQYNLPMAALTMLMGVDAILDMGRTSINVMGNCLACCVMSRIEGTFRGPVWREEEIERRRRAALDDNEKSAAAAAAVGSILPSTTQDLHHQHNEKEINEDKIDVIMHETISPASSIKNNQEDHKAP